MTGEAFSYHRVAVVTPSVITSIRFANHSLLKEIWTKTKPQVPIGLVHHRLRLLRTVLLQPVCVAQLLGGSRVACCCTWGRSGLEPSSNNVKYLHTPGIAGCLTIVLQRSFSFRQKAQLRSSFFRGHGHFHLRPAERKEKD